MRTGSRLRSIPAFLAAAALCLCAARAAAVSTVVTCGPNNSGNTTTSIQWAWNDEGTVDYYNVYNSSNGFLLGTAANGNPTFNDVGLGTNTRRAIYVTAVVGAGEGPPSPAAACFTLAAEPGPGAPLMTSTEATSVSLSWTNNANPNGTVYDVSFTGYVSTFIVNVTTITSIVFVATETTTGFSAYLGKLNPSSNYSATVVALNGSGFPSAPLAASAYTLPAQPSPLTILGTTPVSITGEFSTNLNSTMPVYQVSYSNDNFVGNNVIAIPFRNFAYLISPGIFGSTPTFTISGLLTATQYWVRVQAENVSGQTSQFSGSVATVTFNGGAPQGSIAGVLKAAADSDLSGTLIVSGATTRFIDLRSPRGAFPSDTGLTISTYSLLDHGPLCPNGVAGDSGAGVVVSVVANPALQPSLPVFLTGSYTNAEALSFSPTPASAIGLARFDPASGTCVPLSTVINTSAQTFLARLNHFSLYQLVAVPAATSAVAERVYPNPYRASTDGYVTIDQIPPGSRVRVFTLRGETLLDTAANGAGSVTWLADNGAGRAVASGLYLVVVETGGTRTTRKLAVIR